MGCPFSKSKDESNTLFYSEESRLLKIAKMEHLLRKTRNNHRLALLLLNEYAPGTPAYNETLEGIDILNNIIETRETRLKLLRR
jgi:hypothetical protein